ncbi:hypothetical protein ASD64_11440 [Mesorhizobium sp. Root157]|uniref:hypothetical protein n=1 Tax=Mesorhizobium sp. Root157 TaxID=1736477 RepID=UPI0006F483A5|nr:hypothetical protein [Mesorhizobium sp. Root157]KQZ80898.1 hypothetical protein ASD64_11440 [Mesorhizobium sp. Root157]
MYLNRGIRAVATAFLALSLASCTTSREALNKDPKAITTSALCRSFFSTNDQQFKVDILVELSRRSVSAEQCATMVKQQNQAIAAGVAIAAVGAAVAICANNNCGGGGYTPNYYQGADWDAFYNQYGQIVWACRAIATGQFTYASNCYGKAQTDWRWPGKYRF